MPDQLTYIVCATPRSGSSLLGEQLILTGMAGTPIEWTLPQAFPLARSMLGLDLNYGDEGYFDAIMSRTRSPNGVFGVKIMWRQMEDILAGRLPHWHSDANIKYVHIAREDKVRQAISLFMAQKTNYWQKFEIHDDASDASSDWAAAAIIADTKDGDDRKLFTDRASVRWAAAEIAQELEDTAKREALMTALDACYDLLSEHEDQWAQFFHTRGIAPFKARYETLSADPEGETAKVLRFLGIEAPIRRAPGHLRALSDDRNDLLRTAYEQHRAGA